MTRFFSIRNRYNMLLKNAITFDYLKGELKKLNEMCGNNTVDNVHYGICKEGLECFCSSRCGHCIKRGNDKIANIVRLISCIMIS